MSVNITPEITLLLMAVAMLGVGGGFALAIVVSWILDGIKKSRK